MLLNYRNRRPRPAAAASAPLAPAHLRSSVKIELLDRQAPRDRESIVAGLQALTASYVGLTADSAAEKANLKAIRDLKRKITALRPIPSAEDDEGNLLLDSDDEAIEGEDHDVLFPFFSSSCSEQNDAIHMAQWNTSAFL